MEELILHIVVISLTTVILFGSVGAIESIGKFVYKRSPAFAKFVDKLLED